MTSLFNALEKDGAITNLRIQNHEVIRGVDGEYNFDATVRYELAGMAFQTLVEAKLHKNPIKRETVQVLHQNSCLWEHIRRSWYQRRRSKREHSRSPARTV